MVDKIKEMSLNNKKTNKNNCIQDPDTKKFYRKGKILGGGGFGEVYEFIDDETGEIRAAKIIPLKKLDNPQSNEAYHNEYKFNNSLDYKYICKCFSTFKDNENAYFILEYQPNKTLSDLIQNRHSLTEIEVKHYCYELLLALEYLHSRNIIHRDIKLSNVLLSDKMEVKLCDFGLAIENNTNNSKTICGTPNYIAPEILNLKNNTNYSYEIDIWSFGVILYSLFYHKTPFEDPAKGRTRRNIENINYTFPENKNITESAKNLIRKIFIRDPSLRPTIKEIKESKFFNNGKGIPKYLPPSSREMKISEGYMANFVNEAIKNNECLDNETVIKPVEKNNLKSSIIRYKSIEDYQENEDSEQESDKYNSTDMNKEEENKKEKEEGGNKINQNEEKEKNDNYKRKKRNKTQTVKVEGVGKKLLQFESDAFSFKQMSDKNNRSKFFDYDIENSNINANQSNKNNNENKTNTNNITIKRGISEKAYNISNKNSFTPYKENIIYKDSNKLNNFNSFANDTLGSDGRKISPDWFNPLQDTIDNNNKTTSKEKNTETVLSDTNNFSKNTSNSNLFLSGKMLKLRNLSNDIFSHHISHQSHFKKKMYNIMPQKINFDDIVVLQYIDISYKCGIGYILSNGDIGAYFNDETKLILIKSSFAIIYIDSKGHEKKIDLEEKNDVNLLKKIKILSLFYRKLNKKRKNRNDSYINPLYNKNTVDVYVIKWAKTHRASFFLLSNKEIQVIFCDKTQIIFNMKNKTVLFINHLKQKYKEDMRLKDFSSFEMTVRVLYAKKVLKKL